MLKYRLLLSDRCVIDGVTLYRIQALKDFGDVKAGDLGGYIADSSQLSQNGNCWIYSKSNKLVCGRVTENAIINSLGSNRDSIINGDVFICENSKILNDVDIFGSVDIRGNSIISSKASNIKGFEGIKGFEVKGFEDEVTIIDGSYSYIGISDSIILGSSLKPRVPIDFKDAYIINAVIGKSSNDCKIFGINSRKTIAVYNSFYNAKKITYSENGKLKFFGEFNSLSANKLELLYTKAE